MAQNPEVNDEEYETVDHDEQYQDENITSTSMTGEMAEEDRYEGETGGLLGDEYTSTAGQPIAYGDEEESLISFDSSTPPPIPETTVTQPTPPPTVKSEPQPATTGGAWLENVDPRDDIISDSANEAESKEDVMASPGNKKDLSPERNAPSGAEHEVVDEIRHLSNDENSVNERESVSESVSSMSLDGSSGSSDNYTSESESGSEDSVSETDELDIEQKKRDLAQSNDTEKMSSSTGIDTLVAENKTTECVRYGADNAINECMQNIGKEPQCNSENINSVCAPYQISESSEIDKQFGLDFPRHQASHRKFEESKDDASLIADNVKREMSVTAEEKQNNIPEAEKRVTKILNSHDTYWSPYYKDRKEKKIGNSEALKKQSETTCFEEEARSLSDSSGHSLISIYSSDEVTELNSLYRGSNSIYSADTEITSNTHPDIMEKLRLGILKNDMRVSEELNSDHGSDFDKGSNQSEELHVRFRDEVVIMEYSDEEKEEPSQSDEMDKNVEYIPSDYNVAEPVEVIDKDSTKSMENEDNLMLAKANDQTDAGLSELDLHFHRIEKTDERSVLEQEAGQNTFPSLYSASEDTFLKEQNGNNQQNLLQDRNNHCMDVNLKIDTEKEQLKLGDDNDQEYGLQTSDEVSSSSENDSVDTGSEEESASDSSGDIHVADEWTVSPLCDTEVTVTGVKIKADIPEACPEALLSENVCLLNYETIDEESWMKKSDMPNTSDTGQTETRHIDYVYEEVSDDALRPAIDDTERKSELLEKKTETICPEINIEPQELLDVEIQLKEVEKNLMSKLISESFEASAKQNQIISQDFQGEDKVKKDMSLDYEDVDMECAEGKKLKNDHGVVHEAISVVDNVEKELEQSLDQNLQHGCSENLYTSKQIDENSDVIIDKVPGIDPAAEKEIMKGSMIIREPVAEKYQEITKDSLTEFEPCELTEPPDEILQMPDEDRLKEVRETKGFKILSVDNPVWLESGNKGNVEEMGLQVVTFHEKDDEGATETAVGSSAEELIGLSSHNLGRDLRSGSAVLEVASSSSFSVRLKQVVDLIYWRDVKKTGIVFGSMMFVLISLACFSLMSVLAYLSLAILTVTFSFRVYKSVMQAVQKTSEGHPFKKLLEMNIELKDDVVQEAAENIAKHINNCHRELRRLYLVEDYVDSIKFGMLLWLLTYIGYWFSGMSLIILVVVSIFTLPRVYETYKVQIDTYINMARAQLNKILAQISAKVPFPKKKAKTQ